MTTGGSIESVYINSRRFPVAADADSNRKLGGFENELQPNGDGTARLIKTRVTWRVDGLTISLDDIRGDQEFLQEIADGQDNVPIAVTYASGAVYQGQGMMVDENPASSQNTTMAIVLSGPGKLTRQ